MISGQQNRELKGYAAGSRFEISMFLPATRNLAWVKRFSRMDQRSRLLGQAEQARRIAQSINDPEAVERLQRLADDYEQQARSLGPEGRDDAPKPKK